MPPAKKTVVRKTIARPAEESARAAPLIVLKRTRTEEISTEQVLLFAKEYDDGEVQEFWVPKRRMASLALLYMHKTRKEGDNAATAWLLEEVLGAEAYQDLANDKQLADDELAQIFDIVQNAVMGAAEDPKGSSR